MAILTVGQCDFIWVMNAPMEIDNRQKDSTNQQDSSSRTDLPIKARFARFNSPFMQLMIPTLITRYFWLAIEDINPGNFLDKPDPALKKPGFRPYETPSASRYLSRNFAAIGMGGTILGLIGLYSKRTYDDMKTLYSEAVGYELDKKPQDVTWNDMMKSQNAALAVTRDAYIKRTIARTAAGASFLFPWHKFRDWRSAQPKYDANANAGVGVMGVYLAAYEGFIRKPSFFDVEQNLAVKAASTDDTNVVESVQASDIHSLLLLQRKHLDKNYKMPRLDCEEGQNDTQLSNRIAELMNQTYHNKVKTEHADFTMGKFNYLIGFGMLDVFPASLGFVELANRSTDMKQVNAVAKAINAGQDPHAVFHALGIDINPAHHKEVSDDSPLPAAAHARHSENVHAAKNRFPQERRTYQDFATQQADQPRHDI